MGEPFKPCMVWPLASYLAEEMAARRWTVADLAYQMPGDYGRNALLVSLLMVLPDKGDHKLGEETAAKLAKALGVSEAMIINLHEAWIKHPEARQPFECPERLFGGLDFTLASPDPDPSPHPHDGGAS